MRWGVIKGAIHCVGLCLLPVEGGEVPPLNSSTLRQLPIARLVAESHTQRLADLAEELSSFDEALQLGAISDADRDMLGREQTDEIASRGPGPERRRGGRPRLGDDHYREVAANYLAAYATGRRDVTQQVADQMNTSKSNAAKWVSRARRLGYLPLTTKGKAGGIFPGERDS